MCIIVNDLCSTFAEVVESLENFVNGCSLLVYTDYKKMWLK